MNKDIKDYLHLYLGCELQHINGTVVKMNSIALNKMLINEFELREYKPILRPLSDMTEDEVKEFIGWDRLNELYVDVSIRKENLGIVINYGIDTGEYVDHQTHTVSFHQWSPKEWLWLLNKQFDLFGLIESGLAIDKTKTP